MNLLDIISGQYKRVGRKDGGEYAGPCPWCGDGGKGAASDRFHIWPEQGSHGTYWCRMCGKAGDAIKYLMDHDGMAFKAALEQLGIDASQFTSGQQKVPVGWRPSAAAVPVGTWSEKAAKFTGYCHERLLERPDELAWLAARGIGREMVVKYRLGWNPSHAWREGSAWGITLAKKPNGQRKKLWLPRGLVIPCLSSFDQAAEVVRLRIRQPEGAPRYLVVPGSSREPLCSRAAEAMLIVESELDAILVDGVAGDVVGVVAMGNDTAKPTAKLLPAIEQALAVLVALDSDQPRFNAHTGRMEIAGGQAARWWLDQFEQASRLPIIGGKDPGEAFAAGVDLRAWVLAALPPYFHVKTELEARRAVRIAQTESDATHGIHDEANGASEATVAAPEQKDDSINTAAEVCEVRLPDGRLIYTTGDRAQWQQLAADGKTVFSMWEMQRMQQAMTGMSVPEQIAATALLVDVKEIFSTAWIRRGSVLPAGMEGQ